VEIGKSVLGNRCHGKSVEIDLLRAGQSVLSVPPRRIPRSHRTPYWVVVRRGWMPLQAEVYAVPLRERLPLIGIPFRERDADVPLDLQPLLERCYDNGGYRDDLDYEAEPDPPLPSDEAAWADALLRERGARRPATAPAEEKQGCLTSAKAQVPGASVRRSAAAAWTWRRDNGLLTFWMAPRPEALSRRGRQARKQMRCFPAVASSPTGGGRSDERLRRNGPSSSWLARTANEPRSRTRTESRGGAAAVFSTKR
jgi:hypothetical protein